MTATVVDDSSYMRFPATPLGLFSVLSVCVPVDDNPTLFYPSTHNPTEPPFDLRIGSRWVWWVCDEGVGRGRD